MIDDKLKQALANEEQIDVSMIPDISVMALPLHVKRNCLAITQHLQDAGIDDDPVVRLKRAVKMGSALSRKPDQRQDEGGYASF